jgi:DNA-3-methyladenine glycosylase
MEWEPFDRRFYEVSALELAPRLLGHWLVRREETGLSGGRIVEVEAYLENDPASHAFAGRTARNETMWGPPGFGYVYLIYGLHYCFNAVCLPSGRPEAVLVRAIEADLNPARMRSLRRASQTVSLTNGPAKLCQSLGITRLQDGADLCRADSAVFIARNPGVARFLAGRGPVETTPRVGLSVATDQRLRFVLSRSGFLSRKVLKNGVAFERDAR